MSDVLLERIAKALETIATPKAAPAGAATKTAASAAGGTGKDKAAAEKAAAEKAAAEKAAAEKAAAAAKKAAAAKGAAATPAGDATKGPGGTHTQGEVRKAIQDVVAKDGKQAAMDILAAESPGAPSVSQLKPESYDAVWEACQNILGENGEFDPTA